MKTVSQILKEEGFTFDSRGYAEGLIKESDFIRIANLHAEQVLDEAAATARLSCKSTYNAEPNIITRYFNEGNGEEVCLDKSSILNLKSQLK